MNKLRKVAAIYHLGGVKLLFARVGDRLFKTHNVDKYRYSIFEKAEVKDYPMLAQSQYIMDTGKPLDIEHPKTFNEKLQWIKIYDSIPLKTLLSDKYLARDWIAGQIGEEYLVPLLGVWDKFDDIDFDALPNQFALKCNHGSGWNLIVSDKGVMDFDQAKKDFDQWLKTNFAYYALELQYRDIPPKIIAEKYLEMSGGVKDYRFFCFNGIPKLVRVDLGSGTSGHVSSFFDMEWNKIDMRCQWPDGGDALREKPVNFELMKELATKLSKPFCHVRVDFFEINGKLYMGEMTFTHMDGRGEYDPPEWDLKLGEMLKLPEEKYIVGPKR